VKNSKEKVGDIKLLIDEDNDVLLEKEIKKTSHYFMSNYFMSFYCELLDFYIFSDTF
jgi:hypothetical protein